MNLYAYVGNDPENVIDPEGLQAIPVPGLLPPPIPGHPPQTQLTPQQLGQMQRDISELFIPWPLLLLEMFNQANDRDDWHDRVDYDNWPFGQEHFYPKPPDPEKERRQKLEDDCHEECEQFLGCDRCGQGFDYTNCMKNCMARHNCRYP